MNKKKTKKKNDPSIGEIERWYHSLWDTDRDMYMLIARIIGAFKRNKEGT